MIPLLVYVRHSFIQLFIPGLPISQPSFPISVLLLLLLITHKDTRVRT